MNTLEMGNKNEKLSLSIKAKTWNRDSHGLFDYENNTVKNNSITINQSGSIIRKKNEVKYFNSPEEANINNSEDKELFKINVSNSTLFYNSR